MRLPILALIFLSLSFAPVFAQDETPPSADAKKAPKGWGSSKSIREWKAHQTFSLSISPDGKHLVTGSEDKNAKVWNTESGKTLTDLTGHDDWVRSVRFSPDGKHIVTGGEDQKILVFGLDGKQRSTASTEGGVLDIQFSKDGKSIAVATKDKLVQIFSFPELKLVRDLRGHTDWIWSVAFNADGTWLATASEDDSVRLWDVKTGKEIVELRKSHDKNINAVYTVSFHPTLSKVLLSGNLDNTVDIWDLDKAGEKAKDEEGNEKPMWKETPVHTIDAFDDSVRSISFTDDGTYFATGSSDNRVRIWEWKGLTEVPSLLKTHDAGKGMLWSVEFASDGAYLATGGEDKHIRLWK